MNDPAFQGVQDVAPGVARFVTSHPLGDLGLLAVNAFLLDGREPVLVDTGLAPVREPFLAALESRVDLENLRWIWISHADVDHVGNLAAVLERAPNAEVVSTFLGFGKLALGGLPIERARLIAPGEVLETADRSLAALRPPYFDAPESLGFYDSATRAAFVVDAFGALTHEVWDDADAIPDAVLEDGLHAWARIDAPWLELTEPRRLARAFASVAEREPSVVLSGHLPPARRSLERLSRFAARTFADVGVTA